MRIPVFILANTRFVGLFFSPSTYFFIKEKLITTKIHLLSSAGFHVHLCCRNQDTEQFHHPKKPLHVLLWSTLISPDGLVVKTRTSKAETVGSIPGWVTEIPQVAAKSWKEKTPQNKPLSPSCPWRPRFCFLTSYFCLFQYVIQAGSWAFNQKTVHFNFTQCVCWLYFYWKKKSCLCRVYVWGVEKAYLCQQVCVGDGLSAMQENKATPRGRDAGWWRRQGQAKFYTESKWAVEGEGSLW